jgi:hypothetical protein
MKAPEGRLPGLAPQDLGSYETGMELVQIHERIEPALAEAVPKGLTLPPVASVLPKNEPGLVVEDRTL